MEPVSQSFVTSARLI